ncbi:MAG: bifunctional oligoribonuclease/PAP phosphatase NrnA [Lachnospiraceae bacterium]|jgi:phosphoesterase RecJ-like protein|nr:bifunctional oligoribonuclease/PAP phosphatase NrnA [Lachnospiraceae bacterium]
MDQLNILAACGESAKIGITGHIRPDGDCVASCLALYLYLCKHFPDRYIKVFLESPPAIFAGLSGFDQIDTTFTENTEFDCFLVADCEPNRIGEAKKYFQTAKYTINIDHHISNAGVSCQCNYIRPDISSCCEVIYGVMDPDKLDAQVAEALYVGMIHDTGVFQYESTKPETLETAAKLMRYGFPFWKIIEESFYEKTYIQTQILGRTLMESVRFLNGRCVAGWVTLKTKKFYGIEHGDLNGIVNQLRNIKGVDCAILIHQIGTQEYKVSLRSTDKLDVSAVATYFGGGGHMRAAGCNMKGTIHDCINNLSRIIEQMILPIE